MAVNNLSPETLASISQLTTVKKISDLPTLNIIENIDEEEHITTSSAFNGSYLVTASQLDNGSGLRYYNYKVKLNEITQYLSTLSRTDLETFKHLFNFFIEQLKNNTQDSYVRLVPVNLTENIYDIESNYAYTFDYKLSEVIDEVIGFTYLIDEEGEHVSTYAYTNVLTEGLVTNATLEKYVRNVLGNILGVPTTPAALSEAIDSVIEFVDWFKGYTKNDEDASSLQQLIRTIETKDQEIKNQSYAYTVENRELSYAYTESSYSKLYAYVESSYSKLYTYVESSYNKLYDALSNIDVDVPVEGVDTENNSFTAGGIKYTLVVDNNKNLKFVEYTPITLSSTTQSLSLERDSSGGTLQLRSTPSKECHVINRWEDDVDPGTSTTYSAGSPISATINYYSNVYTTYNLIVRETDAEATATANVIINYNKYAAYIFASDNPTISEVIELVESVTSRPVAKIPVTNGYYILNTGASNLSYNISIGSGAKYIYIVQRQDWYGSRKPYYGSNFPETTSTSNIATDILFYSNYTKYKVIRSNDLMPANTNITVELK